MLWTDNMLIPKNAANPQNAHAVDELLLPAQDRGEVEAWVNYICPINGAKEALIAKDDRSIAEQPADLPQRRRPGQPVCVQGC